MLGLTYVAEIWGELTFTAALGQFWLLPFLVVLNVVDITKVNKWTVWAVITLLLGYPNGMSLKSLVKNYVRLLNIDSTSHSSGLEFSKFKCSSLENRLSCLLQHACSNVIISSNIYRKGMCYHDIIYKTPIPPGLTRN